MAPRKQKQQQQQHRSSSSSRTSRKLTHGPLASLECTTLAEVTYRGQTIRTPVASPTLQQIFLDRLWKEIIEPCQITSRKKIYGKQGNELEWNGVRKRFCVGTNVCTRALEEEVLLSARSSSKRISLVVVASDAIPVAVHIPLLCHAAAIPLLLLDPQSTQELSRRHFPHLRRVTCLAIVSSSSSSEEALDLDDPLDSFVSFILSKL